MNTPLDFTGMSRKAMESIAVAVHVKLRTVKMKTNLTIGATVMGLGALTNDLLLQDFEAGQSFAWAFNLLLIVGCVVSVVGLLMILYVEHRAKKDLFQADLPHNLGKRIWSMPYSELHNAYWMIVSKFNMEGWSMENGK